MTRIKRERVGPKMALAAALVEQTPGRKMYFYAKQIHPACRNGRDNSLGYDPIHRAIRAGLIVLRDGRVYSTSKEGDAAYAAVMREGRAYPPQRGNQERGAGR